VGVDYLVSASLNQIVYVQTVAYTPEKRIQFVSFGLLFTVVFSWLSAGKYIRYGIITYSFC
jgi:hypothetical protein